MCCILIVIMLTNRITTYAIKYFGCYTSDRSLVNCLSKCTIGHGNIDVFLNIIPNQLIL